MAMTRQDWIDYFEAVNGRSPETGEIEAALASGEFTQVEENTESEQTASKQEPATGESQPSSAPSVQTYQETPQAQVPQPQVPAQPSAFAIFVKQFWKWLVSAWKSPTAVVATHKYNGLAAYLLLVLFSTLMVMIPIWKLESTLSSYGGGPVTGPTTVGFGSFITIFIGFAFIIFAIIFGGFVAKRFVYQDKEYTLSRCFEWYGRIFSLNILLLGLAVIFSLLGITTLVLILTLLNYSLFLAASAYALFHTKKTSDMDMFYKYLLAGFVYFIVLVIFISVGLSIAGEFLFKGIFENLPIGGYGF